MKRLFCLTGLLAIALMISCKGENQSKVKEGDEQEAQQSGEKRKPKADENPNDVPNLDERCYVNCYNDWRMHQKEWLKEGYAAPGYYLKDFCLFQRGDTFHIFNINGVPNVCCCTPGNEIWFNHGITTNFTEYQTIGPCFYIDPAGWDHGHVFAPNVIDHDGKYYMAYTGVSRENRQRIGIAVSDDLYHWERVLDKPVIEPEYYDWAFCPSDRGSACRDPHLMKVGNNYYMYYTAVTKEGNGCVALAKSKDMLEWEDAGPVYVAPELSHCESANVQEMDGTYYLFFGGHYEYWSYVTGDSPENFPAQEVRKLKKHITAMEVIKRQGKRWLVCYFYQRPESKKRLFVGVIDWDDAEPVITEISDAAGLAEFGLDQVPGVLPR